MHTQSDVAIIGGGLAGLVSAYELARKGYRVVLFERKNYPRHKVCGEYISNEVKPYLERIGLYPHALKPVAINRFQLSAVNGQVAQTRLPLGGFGISRFALDNFLYKKVLEAGVQVHVKTKITDLSFTNDVFTLTTATKKTHRAKVVLGAHGKRSNVDYALQRKFTQRKTSYVGIKQHYHAGFPADLVALHNFEGGYCGLSQVEEEKVNLCYLTTTRVFQKYASIEAFQQEHLCKNPFLKSFLKKARPAFPKPLVISQINFSAKPQIENHALMLGDAAGLIHPLCGNGMAMAIHGAKIASALSHSFLQKALSRPQMEKEYQKQWQAAFASRLQFGRFAQNLLGRNSLSKVGVALAKLSPPLLRNTVALSHGQPIN
jgi:flavin-dependent dehydrogenase